MKVGVAQGGEGVVSKESSDETDQDRCSAIVEADNPLRRITEVGDDEATLAKSSPWFHSTLATSLLDLSQLRTW